MAASIKAGEEPGVYYVSGSTWSVRSSGISIHTCGPAHLRRAISTPFAYFCTVSQVGNRYSLLKQLGEGSFSQVCLAVDKETQEKVRLPSRVVRSTAYADAVPKGRRCASGLARTRSSMSAAAA
jgi:hypothetical protein